MDDSLHRCLWQISRLASTPMEHGQLSGKIVELILPHLPKAACYLALISPDTGELVFEYGVGWPADTSPIVPDMGLGLAGWCALHGKPISVPNLREDPKMDVWCQPGAESALALPLEDKGHVIGTLYFESTEAGALTPALAERLLPLATEAAAALNHNWLLGQLRNKSSQLEGLLSAAQKVGSRFALDEILTALTAEARTVSNVRICALFLLSEDREALHLHTIDGALASEIDREPIRLEESAVGTAINHNRQVEVPDIRRVEEHHFTQLSQELPLVSFLATPINVEGEVIGVLNIYADHPHRFSNDERKILSTLAGLGAVAVENSRLYNRVLSSEDTLRKNERLTTLGLLSAEIAHEIRNPLTVLRLLFESLDLRFPEKDARNKDVEIIGEKLSQLEEIVSRVLSFGKTRDNLHSRWDLNQLVGDTLQLVRFKLQQVRIRQSFSPHGSPLIVEGGKGQLQQAFLNLIINASQAMPEGGKLHVSVFSEVIDGSTRAVVTFADTGTGIPPQFQGKIFDSFLTGRADGTGLGLGIVRRILRDHQGDITVAETSAQGTIMKIWLPLAN